MRSSSFSTRDILPSLSAFGTPILYVPALLLIWRFDSSIHAFVLLISLAAAEVTGGGIKIFFPTDRPEARSRGTLLKNYSAGSFPSIHCARIAALSVIMMALYPDFLVAILSVLTTLGVGWSRVALREHYLRDVMGGYALGIACAGASLMMIV